MTAQPAADRHPLQDLYFLARAAYETAIGEHNTRCRAEGLFDRDEEKDFQRIEEIADECRTHELFMVQQRAGDAVIQWSVAQSRPLAKTPEHRALLDDLLAAMWRPTIRAKLLDLALRLRA